MKKPKKRYRHCLSPFELKKLMHKHHMLEIWWLIQSRSK